MYLLPRKFVCPKCQYELDWSLHDEQASPVVTVDGITKPICPKCYALFMIHQVGLMEPAANKPSP